MHDDDASVAIRSRKKDVCFAAVVAAVLPVVETSIGAPDDGEDEDGAAATAVVPPDGWAS